MPDAIGIGSLLLSGSPFRNCSVHVVGEAHELAESKNAADGKNIIVRHPRSLVHHLVSLSVPDVPYDCKSTRKIRAW